MKNLHVFWILFIKPKMMVKSKSQLQQEYNRLHKELNHKAADMNLTELKRLKEKETYVGDNLESLSDNNAPPENDHFKVRKTFNNKKRNR